MAGGAAVFLAKGTVNSGMVLGQVAGLSHVPRAGYLAVAITARVTIQPVTPSR